MSTKSMQVDCCIAGGGPAGMMLGFLLARAGLNVAVLEKHADFLRDFRGDTIHPSTLELLHELGLLERFLALPHQKTRTVAAQVGDTVVTVADFTRLPVRCRFIAMVPQWDFLSFLAEAAGHYPGFRLLMQTEAVGLLEENGRVCGILAESAEGPVSVRATLTVGADGRQSTVRARSGFKPVPLGAPMDVLWFGLPRLSTDPEQTMGRFDVGRIFIMINRGDYWQCGFVIAKGSLEHVRTAGLESFRAAVGRLAPFAADRTGGLEDWDQIKLLSVCVDRLSRWYRDGLLCIGDAAHAMSPVGGIGINLAIQDAVATANILAGPLRDGRVETSDLEAVQARRLPPTRLTQRFQVIVQNRILRNVLNSTGTLRAPFVLKLFSRVPILQRLAGRLIGLGVRPEHIASPEHTPS